MVILQDDYSAEGAWNWRGYIPCQHVDACATDEFIESDGSGKYTKVKKSSKVCYTYSNGDVKCFGSVRCCLY